MLVTSVELFKFLFFVVIFLWVMENSLHYKVILGNTSNFYQSVLVMIAAAIIVVVVAVQEIMKHLDFW